MDVTLGHLSGQTADVILQDLVLMLELVVVAADLINAIGQCLQR